MMQSFYRVITDSIEREVYAREFYEELAAKWHLAGYLTDVELAGVMALIGVHFPIVEPVE